MNNLDKIIEKITLEAKGEAEEIIAAAERETAEIKEETQKRVDSIIAAGRARAEKEEAAAALRADGAADMKRREILLSAKVGLIMRAFAEAEDYLCSLEREEYVSFMAHLLSDAVRERVLRVAELRSMYGDEEEYSLDFVAVFNEKDRDAIAADVIKAAKDNLKKESKALAKTTIAVAEDTADIRGGLILRYGDIESNCSVSAVIAEAREKCEAEVAQLLFGAKQ